MRAAPVWLSGYTGVILLMTIILNLSTQLARNGYGLTLPAMKDSLELSHFQAGSLFAALSILSMVAAFVTGTLAPRYGSRIIIGSLAIAAGVGMIFLGASPSFAVALLMSAIVGFATQGCLTPVMGLLSVWFESQSRGTVAGLAAAGGSIGFVLIGALVPWLTGRDPEDGWRHTWYLLGILVIVTGVASLVFIRDRPKEAVEPAAGWGSWPMEAYRNSRVWLITFLAFCSGWAFGLYATFFGVFQQEEGISLAVSGRLWMALGSLGILSGIFWGNMSDRIGRRGGFLFSFITYGVGCLLFWTAPVLIGFMASVALVGLSFRASYTICAAAAGDYVARQFSAAAFGLMGMGASVGSAIGPLIAGRLADVTGDLSWPFILATGGSAIAAFASLFLTRPRTVS